MHTNAWTATLTDAHDALTLTYNASMAAWAQCASAKSTNSCAHQGTHNHRFFAWKATATDASTGVLVGQMNVHEVSGRIWKQKGSCLLISGVMAV